MSPPLFWSFGGTGSFDAAYTGGSRRQREPPCIQVSLPRCTTAKTQSDDGDMDKYVYRRHRISHPPRGKVSSSTHLITRQTRRVSHSAYAAPTLSSLRCLPRTPRTCMYLKPASGGVRGRHNSHIPHFHRSPGVQFAGWFVPGDSSGQRQ